MVIKEDWKDAVLVTLMGKALGTPFTGDDLNRSIYFTSFDGAYGRAGIMAVIEGTPPRGMFILMDEGDRALYAIRNGRMRSATAYVGSKAMQAVREYLVEHIRTMDANRRRDLGIFTYNELRARVEANGA
jgi:hypothetical protein